MHHTRRNQDRGETYSPSRKIAGRFVAIIKPAMASLGEEDSLSPPGTDDKSRCTEAAQAAEESAGSGNESDSEVSVGARRTAQRRKRERAPTKELEWGFRAACSFTPHEGSRSRYREQSLEEKEDYERLLAGLRAPQSRQRRGADREI